MDRFLKRPTPAVDTSSVNSNPSKKPKPSAKQGDVSAAFRAQEFGRNFYDSGGKMFCKPCNTVVDHTRKSVVTAHVKSKVVSCCNSSRFAWRIWSIQSGDVHHLTAGHISFAWSHHSDRTSLLAWFMNGNVLHHTAWIIQIYPPHHHHKAEANRTQKISFKCRTITALLWKFRRNFAA